MDDTSHRRRPPGEGELPLVDLLSQLDELGVRAPISIEVFSDELDAGPPAEAARRAFAGASSTLATARRSR
jgi:sugar phosphate isomerase/epimerase